MDLRLTEPAVSAGGADGSNAARRGPPGHRLRIHPEHQGDLSPGVSSCSWFSTIIISSSGRNSSCQRSRQVRRRGGIRPALVPRLLSVCSGKTAALNGLVGLLVPFA